jgi:hypothetical protein
MRFAFAAIVAIALGICASASAQSSAIATFRTPSGNIGCIYASAEPGLPASVRCDIRSLLKPKPAKPRNCHLDYGDSFTLLRTGRALVTCHGDTALDPHAPVLSYGKVWRRNGFTCASRTTGLRCSNPSGHGFFLSRAHSYRF